MAAARLLLLVAGLAATAAQSASITNLSPQGEVAQVQQIRATFSEAVVPFGSPGLADPLRLDCQGAVPAGSGRWADASSWVYDFEQPLPPGTRCTLAVQPLWKPLQGRLDGATRFAFQTGGPAVEEVQPWDGNTVEEDQHFLLVLSGPAVPASVQRNAWCEVDGIGERIPVRVVDDAARTSLIQARRLQKMAPRLLLLACQRPLPNDTRVRLVWGRGIAALANPAVTTATEQRFDYRVRRAFSADFSCERERANAPCMPIRPLQLRFSAPVARALAQQVRLQPPTGAALAPVFDRDDKAVEVSEVAFPHPLAENTRFTITLPPGLHDAAGRWLANAASFPLGVATGGAPPIAKFAAAPFGVIERGADAVLPLTLRHVQGDLRPAASGGQVRLRRLTTPAEILAWYGRVQRFHETQMTAREAGLPPARWQTEENVTDARGRSVQRTVDRIVATRELSLLQDDPAARRLDLPALAGGDPRPFEVVGIPLPEPGYHVVEIASQRLGTALLAKPAPMFVRTGVLVTNLGVHFKLGRDNSLAWVTTLDRAAPVSDAEVTVHDCRGQVLWHGSTDALGLARIAQPLESDARQCVADAGLFVTARHTDRQGVADTAFVFTSWQQGIEPWRFNVPTGGGGAADVRVHSVLDRSLLRAGETVAMKHVVRRETMAGLALLRTEELPTTLKIVHLGSGQEFTQPLAWSGARSATSRWTIPAAARLGVYRIVLQRDGADETLRRSWDSGDFRVEEFRVPLVDARLQGPADAIVAPRSVALDLRLNHLSGGPVAAATLRASALLSTREPVWPGYEDFSFEPPRDPAAATATEDEPAPRNGRLVADKLALSTDRDGAARWQLAGLPAITRASELLAEVSFNDPNGEVQTVSTRLPLWPSAVVLGVRTGAWASRRGEVGFSVVALDTAGRPLAEQAVTVHGRLARTISTRQRIVGGFYAYDNHTEHEDLGPLCSGRTDRQGMLRCTATLQRAGEVELLARAADGAGRPAVAAASVWITQQGELWFAQDNDDRIELLPERRRYEGGETARLQVRMPFRQATALLAVEREGILKTQVVQLRGDNPTVELKIDGAWGPNVYVSVLALRGRVRELSWASFVDWGWKAPLDFVRSWWADGQAWQAPTALVDLSRPSFKLGVAALQIGSAAHTLQVQVTTDKPQYLIRQTARAHIRVTQDGRPAAGAEVAFAAVDEGLLALRDNSSWDLLGAMWQDRPWGVATSSAHGEIIGRRHYGRKAVAAGGGGGRGGTRELFDTLLLWQPNVTLDARGEATLDVPLNDSLTRFKLVAVADAGAQHFGTGSASIRVSQDLQVLSGLPTLVRAGDRFQALLTLRNTTARALRLRASLAGGPTLLAPQELALAAGATQEISWAVDVPAAGAERIVWDAAVQEVGGSAADRVKVTQRVLPAVPVQVLQATLQQLSGPLALPVAAPATALAGQGGLTLALQPRLGGTLPGLRRWFEAYPYRCLEQQASTALALKDTAGWAELAASLPTWLDSDGLANYFPPGPDDEARGSDRLTAYLLAASHEAGVALPPAVRDSMLDGLAAFVQGRIERRFWAPRDDLAVRKLAAIEALTRYGRAQPALLGSIAITPNQWPTAGVIDWLNILRRLPAIPDQPRRLGEAQQILRARLAFSGTTLRFSTETSDFWWWLMDSADANAARLILAVLDDPAWRADLPRLLVGHLGRAQHGAWLTTTANLWSTLALDKFGARFESAAVSGRTTASSGGAAQTVDWAASAAGGSLALAWPAGPGTVEVQHSGTGQPWLTVQALAAVPLTAPLRAGYGVTRSVSAVQQREAGRWSRGDIVRVRLTVDALADMSWVVASDPVPAGAGILGSGLGRDSAIAAGDERRAGTAWPAFEERGADSFRSTWEFLPRGRHVVEYTLRLNNPGRFQLPPTRVEAMYAPESFGASPNAPLVVVP